MERSLTVPSGQLAHRCGDYGFDEPVWPFLFGLLGVIFAVLGLLNQERLREPRMVVEEHHTLGWRFWYGAPWWATKLVIAHKPSSG